MFYLFYLFLKDETADQQFWCADFGIFFRFQKKCYRSCVQLAPTTECTKNVDQKLKSKNLWKTSENLEPFKNLLGKPGTFREPPSILPRFCFFHILKMWRGQKFSKTSNRCLRGSRFQEVFQRFSVDIFRIWSLLVADWTTWKCINISKLTVLFKICGKITWFSQKIVTDAGSSQLQAVWH